MSRSPCLGLTQSPCRYGSLIWPTWLRGVRDPPSSFELSIVNACAARCGVSLHSSSSSDADHRCTGSSESVPVRMGIIGQRVPSVVLQRSATMASRTTQTVVRFTSAFLLPGFDKPQPAGDYRVDHDEESIEGISRLAWRRIGSFIHLPAIGVQSATHQMLPINPADLNAALGKENKTS